MNQPVIHLIDGYPFIPYQPVGYPTADELIEKSAAYYQHINRRRSVRDFSEKPVPKSVIENLIRAASTAPSGAHKQPWTFCAVSDKELKAKIREAAEAEEKINYGSRMSERWIKDLAPLGTDWQKPFLEDAPWLIVAFKRVHETGEDGEKLNNQNLSQK